MIVSNSSPLIALDRIGRLDLLRHIAADLHVPRAVVRELTPRFKVPAWITVTALVNPAHPEVAHAQLGDGEREAISLAVERSAEAVILDDRAARRAAASLGLSVIGVLRVLLLAKQHGLLATVRPEFDALRAASFRIAPALYAHALAEANE